MTNSFLFIVQVLQLFLQFISADVLSPYPPSAIEIHFEASASTSFGPSLDLIVESRACSFVTDDAGASITSSNVPQHFPG